MTTKTLLRSFAGGEIAAELAGRLDLTKYMTGLALAENFEILPHGPARNRAGFGYVNEVKYSAKATRVIPFSFSTTQTYILELGDQYLRIHTQGATLLSGSSTNITGVTQANPGVVTSAGHGYANGQWLYLASIGGMTQLNGRWVKAAGVTANTYQLNDLAGNPIDTTAYTAYTAGGTATPPLEVETPFLEADLFSIKITQSADVLTLVHPSYDPYELRRLGATSWTLAAISFVPSISAPAAPTVAASPASGTAKTRYKVTAIAQDTLEESLASKPAAVSSKAITGATTANPCALTVVGHGRTAGDAVYVSGVAGMTQLNGNEYLVNAVIDADHFTIKTLEGVPVDATGYTAYTAGGTLDYTDVVNDLTVAGNANTVSWGAVSGAVRYNVYKLKNGLYGYVGQSAVAGGFVDNNITPDFAKTPAIFSTPFASSGDKPGAVGYASGRRVFAGTNNKPQNFWLTRSGTESNLSYSIPTRDDDTIAKRIIAQEVNRIRHIVPLQQLLMLTSGGVWEIYPQNSDILTPTSADAKQKSNDGASDVAPTITGNSVLFIEDATGRKRELKYSSSNGQVAFESNDISVMAPHLFEGYSLLDSAYVKSPYKMTFDVRSDGRLLGCTYMPEHQVIAWHQHLTDGYFESVAAVKEGFEYPLYAVVRRTVNNRSVRYIERQHTRRFAALADAFFVDSGLTYSGAPVSTISGLYHLEGKTVAILADGAEQAPRVVTGGQITLDAEASKVHIGLPYTGQLKTLPFGTEAEQALGQGVKGSINNVYVRVKDAITVEAGQNFTRMREFPARSTEPYDSPPALKTTMLPLGIDGAWSYDSQLCIRHARPSPITILSLVMDVARGT